MDIKITDKPQHRGSRRLYYSNTIDRLARQTNKEILELNDTIELMSLTDVYREFHPATEQYTVFSRAHETFSKIDPILGQKESLNKYEKTEITNPLHTV
jgi:exonuclease III